MEDLTKHQLILLTLLISFVTSVATGIMTFTLLSEAPVEVTQTINRVVEKTIERVVTEEGKPEKVVTTVVVNEEDRVLEAISKSEKSIVRLKTAGADGSEIVAGLGVVVSANGIIVSDLRNYNSASSYSVSFFDGKTYPLGKVFIDNENKLVFLTVAVPKSETQKYTFYPATLGNSDSLKIGQTMVVISGRDSNAASIGRIFQLSFGGDKTTVTDIFSDIKASKSHPGSPALSLSGEVIGLEGPLGEGETEYSFLPINAVKAASVKAVAELSK